MIFLKKKAEEENGFNYYRIFIFWLFGVIINVRMF